MANHYFECPDKIAPFLFLAGTISNSANWQELAAGVLLDKYHVINPRRSSFDVNDKEMTKEQIQWEFEMLKFAPNILFYFSHETVAPITLFEYGVMLGKPDKNLFVYVHEDYPRALDVIVQTSLYRPDLEVRVGKNLLSYCNLLVNETKKPV